MKIKYIRMPLLVFLSSALGLLLATGDEAFAQSVPAIQIAWSVGKCDIENDAEKESLKLFLANPVNGAGNLYSAYLEFQLKKNPLASSLLLATIQLAEDKYVGDDTFGDHFEVSRTSKKGFMNFTGSPALLLTKCAFVDSGEKK